MKMTSQIHFDPLYLPVSVPALFLPIYINTKLKNGGILLKTSIRAILILFAVILIYSFSLSMEVFGAELQPPENFKVEVSKNSITLTWKNADNSGKTAIERSTDYGKFVEIATLSKSRTSYKDTMIGNGDVYIYRARTKDGSKASTYTSEVEVYYIYPINLEITYTADTYVDLSWNLPANIPEIPDDYKIEIERRDSGNTKWSPIATVAVNQLTWRDTTVNPDTTYYYRIKTDYPFESESRYIPGTSGISIRTTYRLDTPLWGYAASDRLIWLEWEMPEENDARVALQKKNSAGEFVTIFSSTYENYYWDMNLEPGKTYTYRLSIRPKNGSSFVYTEEISVKTEQIPQSPRILEVFQLPSQKIALTWDFTIDNESGFEVWRKGHEGWALIADLPKNTQSFVDSGVKSGENYIYKIRAKRDSTVFSPFSRQEEIQYLYPDTPSAPLCYTGDGFITIYSDDEVPENTVYTLEYRYGINDEWKDLKKASHKDRYLMTSIPFTKDTQYQFRIRANSGNIASYSPILDFTGTLPNKPETLNAEVIGYSRVRLTWKNSDDKARGFNIYRVSEVGERKLLKNCGPDEISYIDNTPQPGAKYTYEVAAVNTAGESQKTTITVNIPQKLMFKDISAYGWAQEAIDNLLGKGVLDYRDGSFYPQAAMSKAEASRWIVKAFNIGYNTQVLYTLNDLPPGHAYYRDMVSAINAGIIHPDNTDRIFPGNTLTRRDVLIMINNALNYLGIPLVEGSDEILRGYSDYYDLNPGERHIIASFVRSGVILGDGKSLNLSGKVSRAEAAVIIYRALNRYKAFM